ncbi:hypothetical protein [Microbulbifer sp. SAOS-129_SWC]|uniref:hypothetical protein n=1 Tax=Microbulbifer sp. SAOS-129_SWC TaxID=3145235 RepID=UPI003216535A
MNACSSDNITTEKSKIILHLGPHKTGTTSFQAALAKSEKELARKDVTVLGVQSAHSNKYRKWRKQYAKNLHSFLLGKSSRHKTINELCKRLNELRKIPTDLKRTIIISDENLLGVPPGHFVANSGRRARDFYRAAPLVLEATQRAFSDSDVDVLFVERNLRDFLCSTYRDFALKMQKSEHLNDFVDSLSYDFVDQYEEFFSNIGPNKTISVKIYDFRDFIHNTNRIVSEQIGQPFTARGYQKRNKSLSWKATEVAIHLTPVLHSVAEKKLFSEFLLNRVDGDSQILKQQANHIEKRLRNRARLSLRSLARRLTAILSGK